MTTLELHNAVAAVCPIVGVDSNGNISFDPSATPQQIAAAQAAAVSAKLNGISTRASLTALQIFNWMNNPSNMTPAQKNAAILGTVAYYLSKDRDFAVALAAAIGVAIPFDQANPQG